MHIYFANLLVHKASCCSSNNFSFSNLFSISSNCFLASVSTDKLPFCFRRLFSVCLSINLLYSNCIVIVFDILVVPLSLNLNIL